MNKNKRKLLPIILSAIALVAICGLLIFVGKYYRADSVALAALTSDDKVSVSKNGYGYFFDGETDENALILYPGAKVETAAYAPLCRELAQNGFDVYLANMPLRLAIFGINSADKILKEIDYENYYIAGHSLGGVCASNYASQHPDKFKGVILLASFTVHKLDDDMKTLLIYGSEDKVLAMDKYNDNIGNASSDRAEHVITGGNHAGFGSYGPQKGDGDATISQEAQVKETVDFITNKIREQ